MKAQTQAGQAPADVAANHPGRPWIRTTYQLAASIPSTSETLEARFKDACRCIIYWVRDHVPYPLPQSAWEGESFRLEEPGQKVEAILIPEAGSWSLRLEHPDMPFGDRAAVPGRTWTTDIGLARDRDRVRIGIRSFCASLPYGSDEDIAMTRPRVVLELAQRVGMTDLRPLTRQPWLLADEEDVGRLFDLISSKERRLPVVVLTQPDKSRLGVPVSDYMLPPAELANRCCGLAHVVQLPWQLGYRWTDLVGKPWSVYLGAVRTYHPGIDWQNDHLSQHPATFAERILGWKSPDDDRSGAAPFMDFLVQRLFQGVAGRRMDWGSVLFLPEARRKNAEAARSRSADSGDWKRLYESEIAALNEKISELTKEAQEWADDAHRTAQERDQYKEANRQLRFQVSELRSALSDRTGGRSETEIPIPNGYDDLPEWVNRHLAGRLDLHPRAQRGLKDADFADVGLVYKSLLLLANQYRNQCLGREGAQKEFQRLLGEYGLRLDKSISKGRAGEQGDDYFVRYPTVAGPKRFLEWHLRKGSTKDTRFCLGIYFFWDDETQQVVVGWLPSHLDNRMT